MTDNGSAYRSHASTPSPAAELGIRHLRTRPYRPRTNGKAERFIQTLHPPMGLRPHLPDQRRPHRSPRAWLDHYNYTRPHGGLSHKPPGSRLTQPA